MPNPDTKVTNCFVTIKNNYAIILLVLNASATIFKRGRKYTKQLNGASKNHPSCQIGWQLRC